MMKQIMPNVVFLRSISSASRRVAKEVAAFGKNRRGQQTAEYALIIGVVVAAVLAMQSYIKYGLQGRLKSGVDYVFTQTNALGNTYQFEPEYTSDATTNREKTQTRISTREWSVLNREIIGNEVTRYHREETW